MKFIMKYFILFLYLFNCYNVIKRGKVQLKIEGKIHIDSIFFELSSGLVMEFSYLGSLCIELSILYSANFISSSL